MNFLKFFFFKIYRITLRDSFIILIPLWGLISYVVYTSFYKNFTRTDFNLIGRYDNIITEEILHLYLHSEFVRLQNYFNTKTVYDDPLTPTFNLYFENNDLAGLFRNLPDSGKEKSISGKLIYKKKSYDIKAKLRGGSYWHFTGEHKSWRITLQNKKKINGLTEFDLVNPKVVFSQGDAIYFDLARKLGLWDIENRIVRVNLNGKYSGHSFTLDRLDNNFLLKNKKVSGTIYALDIGSYLATDPMYYFSPPAWINGRGWSILANLNHKEYRGHELYELAKAIRSKNSNVFYEFFLKHFDVELMLSFMSLDTILGIFHHSSTTSVRYFFNNKEGRFVPIPWDPLSWIHDDFIVLSRNPIYDKIRMDPRLNELFLKRLHDVFNNIILEDDIRKNILSSCKKNSDAIADDPNKDGVGLHHILRPRVEQIFPFTLPYYLQACTFFKNQLSKRYSFIKTYYQMPNLQGEFVSKDNITAITLSHDSGLSPLLKAISLNDQPVNTIYYDSNNNNKFDSEDKKIDLSDGAIKDHSGKRLYAVNHFTAHSSDLDLKSFKWFVGRLNIHHRKVNYLYFIPKNLSGIVTAEFEHPYTYEKKRIELKKVKISNISKDFHYSTVKSLKEPSLVLGPGKIEITATKVYNQEVIIKPGTHFVLSKNINLIFKKRVKMLGTAERKITFSAKNETLPFGSIVILERDSAQSQIQHVSILNAAKGYNGLHEFSGALSIYNTSGILIDHLDITSVCESCFGINFYKTSDFKLSNGRVYGIKNSLLRIEKSKGKISNTDLFQTLDSAIEAMFSEVVVENSTMTSFFKMGVSSYQSAVEVKNIVISRGDIGIFSDTAIKSQGVMYSHVREQFEYRR